MVSSGMGHAYPDYRGKSTDEKPVNGVQNMATFWEPDTNKTYWFDGDTNTWYEVGQGGP